jgi:hypothetical protein
MWGAGRSACGAVQGSRLSVRRRQVTHQTAHEAAALNVAAPLGSSVFAELPDPHALTDISSTVALLPSECGFPCDPFAGASDVQVGAVGASWAWRAAWGLLVLLSSAGQAVLGCRRMLDSFWAQYNRAQPACPKGRRDEEPEFLLLCELSPAPTKPNLLRWTPCTWLPLHQHARPPPT